jgi:uncharacterized membrane protein
MIGRLTVSIGLLFAAGAAQLVVLAGGHGLIRTVLALGFLLLVPGWAILQLIDLDVDLLPRVGIAVAVSASVDMAIATALLYAQLWSAELAITLVVVVVVSTVLLDLPPSRRVIDNGARRIWAALGESRT